MRRLKAILTFVLSLTLLATSVSQAMARGQMAAGRMVQLCADGEAVTVMMDAQGNPVTPAHLCPDCLAVAADLPHTAPEPAGAAGRWAGLSLPVPRQLHLQTPLCAYPRGPPVLI